MFQLKHKFTLYALHKYGDNQLFDTIGIKKLNTHLISNPGSDDF